MAIEITKVYKEHYPSLRLIGRRYTNDDRDEAGGFGKQWDEWMGGDRFTAMKRAVQASAFYEDPLGLMTMRGDMTGFTYWIGLFFPAGTDVPDGYDHIDLPESEIGVGWVCGKEENGEIFGSAHGAVCQKLEEHGIGKFRNDIAGQGSDTYCFFERYNCPRFTEKDANGNVTLDYGNYVET
ncbi:MAG TPA: hypothetical protein PKE04_15020 [Clostridia bacterium]|nr:hypothetical protein [Clostridia bacterium]